MVSRLSKFCFRRLMEKEMLILPEQEMTSFSDRNESEPSEDSLKEDFIEPIYIYDDVLDQIRLYLEVGRRSTGKTDFDLAREYFMKALKLVKQNGIVSYQVETINCDIAMTFIREARYLMEADQIDKNLLFDCLKHAEEHLPETLKVREYQEKFPQIYEELARIYSQFGDSRRALINYSKRVQATEVLKNNSKLLLQAKSDFERIYEKEKSFYKFVKHYEEAYSLALSLDEKYLKLVISGELDHKLYMKQEFSTAEHYFQRFYVLSSISGYQEKQAKVSWYLSQIHIKLNQLDYAGQFAKIQLKLAENLGDKKEIFSAKQLLTLIELMTEKEKEHASETPLQKSINQSQEFLKNFELDLVKSAELHRKLGKLFYNDHDKAFCIHLFNKYKLLINGNSDDIQQVDACQFLYEKYPNISAQDVLLMYIVKCYHLI